MRALMFTAWAGSMVVIAVAIGARDLFPLIGYSLLATMSWVFIAALVADYYLVMGIAACVGPTSGAAEIPRSGVAKARASLGRLVPWSAIRAWPDTFLFSHPWGLLGPYSIILGYVGEAWHKARFLTECTLAFEALGALKAFQRSSTLAGAAWRGIDGVGQRAEHIASRRVGSLFLGPVLIVGVPASWYFPHPTVWLTFGTLALLSFLYRWIRKGYARIQDAPLKLSCYHYAVTGEVLAWIPRPLVRDAFVDD